jgi:transporter family-2 protein
MKLVYLLIAFSAGAASSLQGLFNGYWQQKLDLKTILLVNSVVVLAGAALYYGVAVLREGMKGGGEAITPSILVGGVCGLIVIASMAVVFPKIGPLAAVILFIAGQMAAAVAISHFGMLGMGRTLDPLKMVGVFLTLLGAYLVVR